MSSCPNCQFNLVLLSSRSRYRCSLCFRIYSQKSIESIEFRKWNEFQRKKDKELLSRNKKVLLTESQKREKLKQWRIENKEKLREFQREWRDNNREDYNELKRRYWTKHATDLNAKRRERRIKNKEKYVAMEKRQKSKPHYKLNQRIAKLRRSQVYLTQQILKKHPHKLYTPSFQKVLPTFLHSYLLILTALHIFNL